MVRNNRDFIKWIAENANKFNQDILKNKAIEFSIKFVNFDKKTVLKVIKDFEKNVKKV